MANEVIQQSETQRQRVQIETSTARGAFGATKSIDSRSTAKTTGARYRQRSTANQITGRLRLLAQLSTQHMRERDVRHRGFRCAYGPQHRSNQDIGIEIALPDGARNLRESRLQRDAVYPEQGPTYACGGQPAEGGEVEDIRVVRLWSEEIQKVYSTVAGSPPEFKTIITELECRNGSRT